MYKNAFYFILGYVFHKTVVPFFADVTVKTMQKIDDQKLRDQGKEIVRVKVTLAPNNRQVIANDRGYLVEVLENLEGTIEKDGLVTLGELKQLLGKDSTFHDEKLYWGSTAGARINKHLLAENYTLDLPAPIEHVPDAKKA